MPAEITLKKQRLAQTLAYFVVVTGFGLVMSALGPVLPDLAEQTQASLAQIGLLFTLRALGAFFGSLLGGRIFDRLPGHPVMAAGMFVLAATFAVTPFTHNFALLLLVGLMMGFAGGVLLVGANTLLVWVHADHVGPWMNGMSFFNGMGGFFAPIVIASFLTMTGKFTGAFGVAGLLLAAAGAWILFVPSPAIRESQQTAGSAGRMRYGLVLVFALIFLLYGGAEISFTSWLYTFVITLHPAAVTAAVMLNSAFWLAMAVGRLLAIPISARLRPRIVLAIDFLGGLVSLAIILTLADSLPALWIGTIGLGLCMASIFPVLLDFIDRRIKISGAINGVFLAAVSAGAMFFPWLSGVMFETNGPKAAMMVILTTLLTAAGIFGAMTRVRPTQKTE
ncbi:MAG: MFS transporter [Anaerolineaceae bacterium]|jgi:FHS family Na+ dependent glucose MFS transporter 1|nr:MFS transporter [Anaerolineaceae bacterium]